MSVFPTSQAVVREGLQEHSFTVARNLFSQVSELAHHRQDPTGIFSADLSAELIIKTAQTLRNNYGIPVQCLLNNSNLLCLCTANFQLPQPLDPLFNVLVGTAKWHFVSRNSRAMPDAKNEQHQDTLDALESTYSQLAHTIAHFVTDHLPMLLDDRESYCIKLNEKLVVRLRDLFEPGIFFTSDFPLYIENLTNTIFEILEKDHTNFRTEVSQISLLTKADLDLDPLGKFISYSVGSISASIVFPPIQPVITLASLFNVLQWLRLHNGQEILDDRGDNREIRDIVLASGYARLLPFDKNDLQNLAKRIHDHAMSRKSESGLVTLGAPVGTCVLGILRDDFGWERI